MGNIHLVTGYAGREHVTAADMGALNAEIFGSGQLVLGKGNRLAASIVTNNQIKVLDGDIIMQGRHIRLNEGAYVDLTIENGSQGMLRNDLIVARYTKNSGTGVEDCNLVVLKGTPVASNPVDPEYTVGDILNGAAVLNDMPLYRVPLNGLNVGELVPLFSEFVSLEQIKADVLAEVDETLENFDGGLQMELLWENANPTSVFAEQTVAVNLNEYKFIRIVVTTSTSNATYIHADASVGKKGCLYFVWANDNTRDQRNFTVTTTEVQFENAIRNTGSNNGALIPVAIYGIKGVS